MRKEKKNRTWSNKEWDSLSKQRGEHSSPQQNELISNALVDSHWIDVQIDIDKWETINTLYLHDP